MTWRIHHIVWFFFIVCIGITAVRHVPLASLAATVSLAVDQPPSAVAEPFANTSITDNFEATIARTDLLAMMTLREKIGQMFIIGHWEQNDFYHTTNMLRAYHFGGVIIMDVSPRNSDFVSVWTREWQEDSVVLPALVAIDQEGGVVSRLRGPDYNNTSQRELDSAEEARAVGTARADELATLGINVNLAPVLDTSVNPASFLYDRSFANPASSSLFADTLIQSHKNQGVLSAVKHYPGHADTADDSHEVLPIIDIPAEQYASFTQPFTEVIKRSQPAVVMTAHVLLPNIDPSYPATLSKEILTNRLRQSVGYEGIIMTDDMTMGAITNTWSTNDATVQAIKAGADMILFAAQPNDSIAAIDAVVAAVERGEITEDRINQSVERILKVKRGLFDI